MSLRHMGLHFLVLLSICVPIFLCFSLIPSLFMSVCLCLSIPPNDSFSQFLCLPVSLVSLSLFPLMLALPLCLNFCLWFSFSDLSLCVPVPPSPHLTSLSSLSLPCFLTIPDYLCSSSIGLSLPWYLPLCDPVPLFLLVASSGDSGNWIEIAYGTSSGGVRVIVQHPETVGSGPQLFQTFTVHRSPVTKIMLSEKHLISGGLVDCPKSPSSCRWGGSDGSMKPGR